MRTDGNERCTAMVVVHDNLDGACVGVGIERRLLSARVNLSVECERHQVLCLARKLRQLAARLELTTGAVE